MRLLVDPADLQLSSQMWPNRDKGAVWPFLVQVIDTGGTFVHYQRFMKPVECLDALDDNAIRSTCLNSQTYEKKFGDLNLEVSLHVDLP